MRLLHDEEAGSDARAASQSLAQEVIVQQEEACWEQSCAHAQHGCARRQDLAARWQMADGTAYLSKVYIDYVRT